MPVSAIVYFGSTICSLPRATSSQMCQVECNAMPRLATAASRKDSPTLLSRRLEPHEGPDGATGHREPGDTAVPLLSVLERAICGAEPACDVITLESKPRKARQEGHCRCTGCIEDYPPTHSARATVS